MFGLFPETLGGGFNDFSGFCPKLEEMIHCDYTNIFCWQVGEQDHITPKVTCIHVVYFAKLGEYATYSLPESEKNALNHELHSGKLT